MAVVGEEEAMIDKLCTHWSILHKHLYMVKRKKALAYLWASPQERGIWGTGVPDRTVSMSAVHVHPGLPSLPTAVCMLSTEAGWHPLRNPLSVHDPLCDIWWEENGKTQFFALLWLWNINIWGKATESSENHIHYRFKLVADSHWLLAKSRN